MRWWLGLLVLVPTLASASEGPLPDYGPAVADPPVGEVDGAAQPASPHANPRIELSFRRFAVNGPDGNPVALDGGQVDVYPLSRRWLRLGIEAEGGRGSSDTQQVTARLWYGLVGVTAGIQYPARVTPFVEGRAAVGALGGSLSGTAVIGSTSVSTQGLSTTTLLYLGGIDAGVEVYAVGRAYVTVALGWVHPVYYGLSAVVLQTTGSARTTRVGADVFTFKIGVGF